MKVEFSRPDSPTLAGTATWVDGRAVIESDDDELRAALERVFRMTPVVTDDASFRRQGTHGEVLLQPGSLEWFRAAAFVRAPEEAGVEARLVPGITEGGYDPAARYGRFQDSIERLSSDH